MSATPHIPDAPQHPAAAGRRGTAKRSLEELAARDRAVLRLLEQAADAGEPCPSARTIQRLLGAASKTIAPRYLARLERMGKIRVVSYANGRVVTITRTGATTAAPDCQEPHWRRQRAEARIAMGVAIGAGCAGASWAGACGAGEYAGGIGAGDAAAPASRFAAGASGSGHGASAIGVMGAGAGASGAGASGAGAGRAGNGVSGYGASAIRVMEADAAGVGNGASGADAAGAGTGGASGRAGAASAATASTRPATPGAATTPGASATADAGFTPRDPYADIVAGSCPPIASAGAAAAAAGLPPVLRHVLEGRPLSPSFTRLREDHGALADDMRAEAFRLDRDLPGFLAHLCHLGWLHHVATKAQAGASAGLM